MRLLLLSYILVIFFGTLNAKEVSGASPSTTPDVRPTSEVRFTDRVLMHDVPGFGVNLSEDSWHTGAVLTKERVRNGHFEGVLFRQITYGPTATRNRYVDSFPAGSWLPVLEKANATFVTGPVKGPATIINIDEVTNDKQKVVPRYNLAKLRKKPAPFDGFLLEYESPETGWIGQHGGDWWVFCSKDARVETIACPPPPGDSGRVSAQLEAGNGTAEIIAPLFDARFAASQGVWTLRLYCKGKGHITIWVGNLEQRHRNALFKKRIPLRDAWNFTELSVPLPDVDKGLVALGFAATNSTAVLEGISFRMRDDLTPTAFRAPVVKTLQRLRPGSLRAPQIGGSSLDNWLAPPDTRMAYSSSRFDPPPDGNWPSHPKEGSKARTHAFNLHQFLELCAEVKTVPWICTPGTFSTGEIRRLVEYLAGPVTSDMGRLRANMGQVRPWTSVFKALHIEIGNEAWNAIPPYLLGGYSVKGEYWNDLFRSARTSPWASSVIRLHAGGQAVNAWLNRRIATEVPRADRVAIGPYLLHDLSAETAGWTPEKLLNMVRGAAHFYDTSGWMAQNTREVDRPLSVYEVNYHPTGGDAPLAPRNTIVSSVGGNVILMDWLMRLVAHHGCRPVNVFTLLHEKHTIAQGPLDLWGVALNLRKDRTRVRPLFLAMVLANSVLKGELMQMDISGSPTASTPFLPKERKKPVSAPLLTAYGIRDGNRRAVILLNMDMRLALRVVLPEARGKNTRVRLLSGPRCTSTNENTTIAAKVAIHTIDGSGKHEELLLPAASMAVVQWEVTP